MLRLGVFRGSGNGGFLQGSAKDRTEQLAELTLTEGISGYLLFQMDDADAIRKFATEVAPGVREMVTTARA